ncbi:MAG: holo-ACP synthase [Cytophagaceae bacterium]|nr:holo-ACP synthase [Cytophagaceae bacterium]MDW8457156.1 holo-ACP synthase [Cytophagaceae bacterium]
MVYGIGTDLIEVDRIRAIIEKERGFREKVFTPDEIKYCESRPNSKAEHYAVRYAAKEAFFKALGTGLRAGMSFLDLEIMNDALGKPELIIRGDTQKKLEKWGNVNILLTLSHVKQMATAFVVIQKAS